MRNCHCPKNAEDLCVDIMCPRKMPFDPEKDRLYYDETPIVLTAANPEINITFHQEDDDGVSQEVGKLWFDREQRMWFFDGDKDKSAVEFVAWLRVTFKQQINEEYAVESAEQMQLQIWLTGLRDKLEVGEVDDVKKQLDIALGRIQDDRAGDGGADREGSMEATGGEASDSNEHAGSSDEHSGGPAEESCGADPYNSGAK